MVSLTLDMIDRILLSLNYPSTATMRGRQKGWWRDMQ